MSKIILKNKFKHYIKNNNKAVSTILGSVFLLSAAVLSFSVIYYNVLSIPPPSDPPIVTIIGSIEHNNLVLEHQKGDSLNLDTEITVHMDIINETFVVKNYLDTNATIDGEWNIGERLIYPFPFSIQNIRSYYASNIMVRDIDSNSLIFTGIADVYPETDMGLNITADNLYPSFGSEVNITMCVTNYEGGTPAKNIEILNLLPYGLKHVSNLTSHGFYSSETGIWNISNLTSGESACLTITATVLLTSNPTQLAIILDGSSSISSGDWNLMRTGLANAIKDPSVFPHDGHVELTVFQFGQKSWWPFWAPPQYARKELGAVMVKESNYLSIANTIQNLHQLGGYTPMGCGIYLAADTMLNSLNVDPSDRQVVCLVTDGQPNCNCNPLNYIGSFVDDNYVTGRLTAEQGRDYLISTLNLNFSERDQFDCIAVGQDTNTPWLKDNITWPQPGNYAPPYNPGWVRNVSSWQGFSECIYEIFRELFGLSVTDYVQINVVVPSNDPNPEDNIVSITFMPD